MARGRTAEVFAWKDGQVLKLFLDWVPSVWVETEAKVSRAVYEAGLPAPATEGLVEVNGRRGIVFERVEGPSMLAEFRSKPWKLVRSARQLAELHAAIHALPGAELPANRQRLEGSIRAAQALPAPTKEAVLSALARLPDGDALLHGDFHPDNVIMTARGPIIIDWMTATRGNPLADVARTSMLLGLGALLPGTPGRRVIEAGRQLYHAIYLRRYLQLCRASREDVAAWRLPTLAARLNENIAAEQAQLLALVEAALRRGNGHREAEGGE
jgi:aminoglycoside phosphotransferase (APT) family kinase protein